MFAIYSPAVRLEKSTTKFNVSGVWLITCCPKTLKIETELITSWELIVKLEVTGFGYVEMLVASKSLVPKTVSTITTLPRAA